MSFTATYNGETFSQVRNWSLNTVDERTFDGKKVKKQRLTYAFSAYYGGLANASSRNTKLATLRTKLEEPEKRFQLTMDSTDILDLDPASNVIEGPFVTYSVPDRDALKWGYNVPVEVSVEVVVDVQGSGTILARSEEVTTEIDDEGYETRTTRGEIKVANGNSALAQLSTVTPAARSGFDRRSNYRTDANDLEMEYEFTDVESREANNPAGPGSQWQVQANVTDDGQELWVVSGVLKFAKGIAANEGAVDTLVAQLMPGGALIVNRNMTLIPNENSIRFTVSAKRAWGKNGVYMFIQSVRLRQAKTRRYYQATDSSGDDVRQDFARPVVEVTQSGSAIGHGGYPAFPTQLFDGEDLDEPAEDMGRLGVEPTTGVVAWGAISWQYRYRLLNQTEAGETKKFEDLAKKPAELQNAYPTTGEKSTAKVA